MVRTRNHGYLREPRCRHRQLRCLPEALRQGAAVVEVVAEAAGEAGGLELVLLLQEPRPLPERLEPAVPTVAEDVEGVAAEGVAAGLPLLLLHPLHPCSWWTFI